MGDIMFTVSTGLAAFLCIIPGIVHMQTRNHGAIFMTFWVLCANIIVFVNSILWPDNKDLSDKAPIWCLITSPLYIAANFGLLSSTTCTIYTMYTYVASPIILTEKVKRRQAIRAVIVTLVFPIIFMGLFYIVQVNKYSIRPVIGCGSLAQQNWVFFVVNNMWPPIIAFVGCCYAGVTSYAIIKKRLEIQSLLAYNESGINTSYYYRLVLFCITFLVFCLPATLLNTFSNLLDGVVPYDMSVRDFNAILVFSGENQGATFVDYAKPLSGFVLFIFFGTGQEAIATYKKWAKAIKLDKVFGKYFGKCFGSDDRRNSSGTLKTFQGQSTLYSNNEKRSLPLPKSYGSRAISSSQLTPPPKVMMSQEKKFGFKNILYLNGHRTPSEQAAFDLTSGLKIKIDGIDTRTVIHEYDEDLQETPAPAYRGIEEALNSINIVVPKGDDDFGTKRYEDDDFGAQHYVENVENDNYEDLVLEYSTSPELPRPQMGFGDVGSVSHLNHLLSVYNEVPTINVTPSSPSQQNYAMIRVHDTDTFVANGYDDVIDEYSPGDESSRSSYETGIAL